MSFLFVATSVTYHLMIETHHSQTETNAHGQSVTTLWKAIRANKEDRVAKLEWATNGGLGRAVIGKVIFKNGIDQIPVDIAERLHFFIFKRARCLWPTSSAQILASP